MSQQHIIPSINRPTFEAVMEDIKKIEPFAQWCHIDVTDGIFSTHPTWRNPEDLEWLKTKLQSEVHLMMVQPEKVIEKWTKKPVDRVIVQAEAVKDIYFLIKCCREQGVELGLSVSPEVSWELLQPWFDKVDLVQILTVHPGPSGQHPDWDKNWDKLIHVRKNCQYCIIEIDGGINPETAKKARDLGANLIVAGSYIFNHPNIKEAFENLMRSNLINLPRI